KKKEAAVMQTPVPASQSDKIKVSEQTPAQPVAQPQPARQIPAPQEIQAQPPTTPPAQMQTQPAPVPTSARTNATLQSQPLPDFSVLEKYTQPVIENKPNGSINWTQQYVEAKGQSVIDNERFKNPAQAKAMATRGAVVVAQRNLLEMVQGVNVVGETTVQDMITTSDYIYTRVEGLIKGAQQFGPAKELDGMIEVTMRMPIYGNDGIASAFGEGDLSAARKRSGFRDPSAAIADPTGDDVLDGSNP